MLRLYVKSRPYLMAASLVLVAWYNAWVALDVPFLDTPGELVERYFGVAPDEEPSRLRQLADQGNTLAAYYYALRHTAYCPRDLRIKSDRLEAFKYMSKAAEDRRPRAMAVLALYHLRGMGTSPDETQARTWAERAARKDQALALRVLAELEKRAWDRLGAELWPAEGGAKAEDPNRSARTKVHAETGRKALEHYRAAAARGNLGATKALGDLYDKGDLGLARNHRLATEQYVAAALRRHLESAKLLAERYEQGEKVERDQRLAYAWTLVELELADDKADPRRRRDELETRLTVTEKLAAQDQAAQWLALMPSEDDSARARLNPDR